MVDKWAQHVFGISLASNIAMLIVKGINPMSVVCTVVTIVGIFLYFRIQKSDER